MWAGIYGPDRLTLGRARARSVTVTGARLVGADARGKYSTVSAVQQRGTHRTARKSRRAGGGCFAGGARRVRRRPTRRWYGCGRMRCGRPAGRDGRVSPAGVRACIGMHGRRRARPEHRSIHLLQSSIFFPI